MGLPESLIEIAVRIRAPSTVCNLILTEMSRKVEQFPDRGGVEIPLPQRVIRYAGCRP